MKPLKTILLITALLFVKIVIQAQENNIRWIEVIGGSFSTGDDNSLRQNTIGDFYMSATEVTFDQYDTFCEATGKEKPDDNGWGRGNRPAIHVSWYDAIDFCKWLSKETGSKVRLPQEEEWEYAALGGDKSKGYIYSGSDKWQEVSWSERNSGDRTQPVGGKKPNELGLCDMSGNVWEWCADWPEKNDTKVGKDIKRAARGNSFDNPASDPRQPAVRVEAHARHYNLGFRVAKTK
nr:SUMF1/EgtB/PvdO family nonheme iron enzyme [Bacteroidota bacterium]